MISFQFETYIADGAEHYSYGADYGKGMVQTSKTVSFPESLLSLVDMNIDEIEPAIRQLNEVLWQLTTTREKQYAEEVNALLDELELRHIYFQQLALDWRYRLSRAVIFEQYTEDMLPRKYLYALPDTLRRMQGQIVELFENVLDADNSDEPTSKRMVDYYQRSGETAFRFYPQPIGFELIGEVFTEVLTPNNIYDTLLDQVLAHMDDLTLTEQLKALLEEKQHLQTRIDAAKKEAANRINEDSRMAELAAYLEEHLSGFQQYDDGIVRKMIERVTVVDEETIRVKFRYSDLEIEQTVR